MSRKMPLQTIRMEETMLESVDSYGRMFVECIKANLEMDENEENDEVEPVAIPEPDLDEEK